MLDWTWWEERLGIVFTSGLTLLTAIGVLLREWWKHKYNTDLAEGDHQEKFIASLLKQIEQYVVWQQQREQRLMEMTKLLDEQAYKAIQDREALHERYEAELLAREQHDAESALFRAVWEQNPLGCVLLSASLKLQAVNPRFCSLLGYTEEELIGQPCSIVIPPEEQEEARQRMHEILRAPLGMCSHIETCYLQKSGQAAPVGVWTVTIKVKNVKAFLALIEDRRKD